MLISPFERDISINYTDNSYIKSTNNALKTHFMPRESWPTGSLRFLLLLVSFLRKKPSGNQSVLCSRLRRAINMPTIKITNKKREATPTSSSLPHSGISSGSFLFSPERELEMISMIMKYSWTYVRKQLGLCKCGYLPYTSFRGYGKFNISLADKAPRYSAAMLALRKQSPEPWEQSLLSISKYTIDLQKNQRVFKAHSH